MRRYLVALFIFIGIAAFSIYFVFSEAASEENFDKITNGMSQAEVRELLGESDSTWGGEPDRTPFYYGGFRRFKWCTMQVIFDQDGKVVSKFHDH